MVQNVGSDQSGTSPHHAWRYSGDAAELRSDTRRHHRRRTDGHLAVARADGLSARRSLQLRLARSPFRLSRWSQRRSHTARVAASRGWRRNSNWAQGRVSGEGDRAVPVAGHGWPRSRRRVELGIGAHAGRPGKNPPGFAQSRLGPPDAALESDDVPHGAGGISDDAPDAAGHQATGRVDADDGKESRMIPLSRVKADVREQVLTLPGDALIPNAVDSWTHATTLRCRASAAWPWLVQMGAERAGWYSYDWIDNGKQPSATCIIP